MHLHAFIGHFAMGEVYVKEEKKLDVLCGLFIMC